MNYEVEGENIFMIDDYEKILSEDMGIPNVSLKELSFAYEKEFAEALLLIFEKYPLLKNSICAIGNVESINNQIALIGSVTNKDGKWSEFEDNSTLAMAVCFHRELENKFLKIFKPSAIITFVGISLGKVVLDKNTFDEQMEKATNYGYLTNYTSSVKGIVFHEVGHLLDELLNISDSIEFKEILSLKTWNLLTDLDVAAGMSLKELLAEAFSEYTLNPNPSEFVSLIGQLIDKKYFDVKDKNIFNINYRYKDFLERAENEMRGKKR